MPFKKKMMRLCYLVILKEGLSSSVMLISRKVTQDKRVVTDFRHLNMQIAKNNLAYPLLKDTFTRLGSSKCEVLSVLDLKDPFHSHRLSENSKKVLWIYSILWQCLIYVSEDTYGSTHLPCNLAILYKFNFGLFAKQKIL